MIWTPYKLTLLLHIHAIAEPWENTDAPAYTEAMKEFIDNGLVTRGDGPNLYFKTTERAKVFIAALENLPLPVQKWMMPNETD